MRTVTDIELAWMACALDGEGNITLYPQTQNGYSTYRPVLQVINTNRDFVAHAARICIDMGATFVKIYRRSAQEPYQQVYQLQLRGQSAVRLVLTKLLPWLIIKQDFAKALVEYLNATHKRAMSRAPKEPWEIEEAERIRAKYMPRSRSHANGKAPDSEVIPCQAAEGNGSAEGVETRSVSPNNNPTHERPGSSIVKFPKPRSMKYTLEDREIVRHSDENRSPCINNKGACK